MPEEDHTTEFHLQARRLIGQLSAPRSDDCRRDESDSREALLVQARTLAPEGFTVWIFRRCPGGAASARCTSRLVDRIDPAERRPEAGPATPADPPRTARTARRQ